MIIINVLFSFRHGVPPLRKQNVSFLALRLPLVFSMCENQCRMSSTMNYTALFTEASL